jgi:bis(5'-nucleosyl)-tetraphosphatase (symmetrical)
MTTYAIGDIQGCFFSFQALIKKIHFNAKHDQLWLVGDLINRGNGSLEVLRWCYAHRDNIQVVLGNHDLHAIAVAHQIKPAHKSDTLQAILDAVDGEQLLTWLRHQPLLINEQAHVMVHAGLLPQWTVTQAQSLADEVTQVLRSEQYVDFLRQMYGNHPSYWHEDLTGYDRLRAITNAMTRMRVCSLEGELEFAFKGEPNNAPHGYLPWFKVGNRLSKDATIICGHWSALGLHMQDNIVALDTGCLWGGQLTAYCLDTKAVVQVPFDARDRMLLN